jgi:hypothetical protein
VVLEIITMQQAIDSEYGTFEEEVDAVWFSPDAADVRVLTPHGGVYSFETGGGLMFEWVLEPDFDEE